MSRRAARPLRVGIVGWGEIARVHARHARAVGARVTAVVSRRGRGPEGARVFPTVAAMLPHVDAVTVAVPNHLHAGVCLQCVRAGLPVLVEKPLAIDRAQLTRLEAELPAASAPVHVGFRLRHDPRFLELRGLDRRLARVSCRFELGIDDLAAGKEWTLRRSETGGTLFTLGVHVHDLARWIAGAGDAPLRGLEVSAGALLSDADYPLAARTTGVTGGGVEIEAIADTRPGLEYALRVRVELVDPPEARCVSHGKDGEEAQYRSLVAEFIDAAREGRVDREAVRIDLRVHRDLVEARALLDEAES